MKKLYYFLALVTFVAAMMAGSATTRQGYFEREAKRFETRLHRKAQLLQEELDRLAREMDESVSLEVLSRNSQALQDLANEHSIYLFYFENNELRYWSDHSVALDSHWDRRMNNSFVSLRNADYMSVGQVAGNGRLYGLVLINSHFPVQNRFLVNGFQEGFRLDPGVRIEFLEDNGSYPIFSTGGEYLFSLDFSQVSRRKETPGKSAGILFFLSIIFLLAAFLVQLRFSSGRIRTMWIIGLTILIPLVVHLFLSYVIPYLFSESEFFSPELFASRKFPSLGHLGLISLSGMTLVYIYVFYAARSGMNLRIRKALSIFIVGVAVVLFLFIEHLVQILVLDSGISFEANRITSFSIYSFAGLLIIFCWINALAMLLDRAILCFEGSWKWRIATGSGVITLGFILAHVLPGEQGSWFGWITLQLLFLAQIYISQERSGRVPFSRFIFSFLFISAFLVIRLQEYNKIKLEGQREVAMVKLSSEHDPVAEMLFSERTMAIRNDSVLGTYMEGAFIDIDPLISHLRRNYFSGYWSKYDMVVTVCRPEDSVYLEEGEALNLPCYGFFDDMVQEEGIAIPSSDFYFLDNFNGRISYLGAIPYFHDDYEQRVYIELDSRILSEELGYPELLLNDRYKAYTSLDFSSARYHDGELITRDGVFPYRRSASFYTKGEHRYESISMEGFDHSIYNVDGENTIIVGSPSISLIDYLISFSYLFAFMFILAACIYMLITMRMRQRDLGWNFKNRIQYTMVGVLFLTFALISSGTIYFVVQQSRDRNNDNLRNIMRSVYIELIHKLEFEEDLRNWSSDTYFNLDELLQKFSNVFYTDINLYDLDGVLLATSRQEIFERQLLSHRMNRMVFEELSEEAMSEYIHNEHIGRMKFISSYVPLLNSENQVLAYLNLPYFTQSGALTRDVTNVVMAIVNIYLILLLLILGGSVFLADRITQPLRVIQDRMARVSLGAKNEKISYGRSDEIRGLVEEYNFMVEELERSAELLAQSERESAWREMAKQIAHEIKNPLTPMKLNVQHLQKTLGEGKYDRERVDRIAATLIEQIDSLSAIAREFSDFAKMPRAKSAKINLVRKLENLKQLYAQAENAEFHLELNDHSHVLVYADKEQLMRVFINLVKNALQSIPETRDGLVEVALRVTGGKAVISISDNGKGVPEEIRDRLFRPNFTTKSGGMGMGLAISSNIVRSMGGEIWFESREDLGTTFFIKIPLMVDN